MKTFQFVIFIVTIVNVICGEKRSTNEKLQDVQLNQGEYFPSEEELKGYDEQYGYKSRSNRYYAPEQQEAHSAPGLTPVQHPTNMAYATVHQTKIMPVKVIREGPIKHVYLPEYYNDQSTQIKSTRTAKAYENFNQAYRNIKRTSFNDQYPYNSYNPGMYQQNYFRPSVQYNYLPNTVSKFNQGSLGHGYNAVSSGYRVVKPNITPLIPQYGSQLGYSSGFGNNLYPASFQYFPQTFSSQIPSYQGGFTNQRVPKLATINIQPQNSYDISDQYKSLVSSQHNNNAYTTSQSDNNAYTTSQSDNNAYTTSQSSQAQELTPAVPKNLGNKQNSNNSEKEGNFVPVSGLDPELAQIVNDVLQGKGTATHDGFTVVKSKTDKAIYLIGKPGMSLSTIPNFSTYNYASFQNDDKSAQTKTDDKITT